MKQRIFNDKQFPYLVDEKGNIYSELTSKILKICNDEDGYKIVSILDKTYRVARIVLRTFNDTPNNQFLQVKYRDGNRQNVALSNLYWEDENSIGVIEGEEWEKIIHKGKETYYSISNMGRCRNDSKGTILKGKFNKYTGYVSYCLGYGSQHNEIYVSAHRTVMMTFAPCPYMEQLEVNHIDGNKTNNKLSNLEWCTHLENMEHAVRSNLMSSSRLHSNIYVYDLEGKYLFTTTPYDLEQTENISRRKIYDCLRGASRSIESKYQIFEEDKGKQVEPWYHPTTAIEIYIYTKDGMLLCTAQSQKEASAKCGINESSLSYAIKNGSLIKGKYIVSRNPLT